MKKSVFAAMLLLVYVTISCDPKQVEEDLIVPDHPQAVIVEETDSLAPLFKYSVQEDVTIDAYFNWVDSLVNTYDSLVPYELSELILVQSNSWLIDTFAHTDYYYRMDKGEFVHDQRSMVILKVGDTLDIPSGAVADQLQAKIKAIRLDVNIPEYKLRIWEGNKILETFPVRVGQSRVKYLESEGKLVNLKTKLGEGFISNINRDPQYISFTTGKVFTHTRRDDQQSTLMPRIPSLEPEINGICYGQLIHPTTNLNTLGKAYSHGCIGTKEGDAWKIYFHTRIGTPIRIRYDLTVVDDLGDTVVLEDIYGSG